MTPGVLPLGPCGAEFVAERERAHAKHRDSSMEEMPPFDLNRLSVLLEEVGEITEEVDKIGEGYSDILVPLNTSMGKISRIFNDARHAAFDINSPLALAEHLQARHWLLAEELATLERTLSDWAHEGTDQEEVAAFRKELIQLGAMVYAWRDAVLTRRGDVIDHHAHHCNRDPIECSYEALEGEYAACVALLRTHGLATAAMKASPELHPDDAEAQDA